MRSCRRALRDNVSVEGVTFVWGEELSLELDAKRVEKKEIMMRLTAVCTNCNKRDTTEQEW